ncbi:MAG: FkbM family methyltransferase [Desulfobulbaceae bacterium]
MGGVAPRVITQTPSFDDRIANMIKVGFSPKCIFDCGASVGQWSYKVSRLFPGAQIVAIEPNSMVIEKAREQLKSVRPAVILEQCAIGATTGTAFLNIWDNEHTKMSGSSLKDHVQGEPRNKMEVRLETLDNICQRHKTVPDLVKLDLQGGELEALKGAEQILQNTEVIISEFGCLPAYIDRTTPFDLMKVMYEHDYCLYDIIDLIYRPYDNALTGGDFIFVKNSSALKKYKGYK